MYCWGSNRSGQLGNGATADGLVPVAVNGLAGGAATISAGDGHTCAMTAAGGVMCWGGNRHGQLGNGSTVDSLVPVAVGGLPDEVLEVSAGGDHACVVTSSSKLRCWGANQYGQLGDGSTADRSSPTLVSAFPHDYDVIEVELGVSHTCAVTRFDQAWCWGNNDHGQLGIGSTANSSVPVAVADLGLGGAAMAAGQHHTCGLTGVGGLRCWGRNDLGQLGNGSTTDSLVPISIRSGQSIGFAPGTPANGLATVGAGASIPLSATATGGGSQPITYDVWTPDACSLDGDTLRITGAAGHLCGVLAARAGGSDGSSGTTANAPSRPRLLRITPASPGLALASAAAAVTADADVVFTATLSDASLPVGGTVAFKDGSATIAGCDAIAPDGGGVASCTTRFADVGVHPTTAFFGGDANNAMVTSAVMEQIVGVVPAITSRASAHFVVGQKGGFALTATGSPRPVLALSGALPAGVDFIDHGDGMATLLGVPAAGSAGDYTLHLDALNALGSDTQDFTLTIAGASQAALSVSAMPNRLIPHTTSQLSASGGSGTGALSYALDDGPCRLAGSVVTATGAGTCTVRATKAADDHYGEASATATIVVQAAALPVAQAQSVSVAFNTPQPVQLAGSDDNPGGPYAFTYALVASPSHGTISHFDTGTGAVTYTPAPGHAGSDAFTFTVSTVNGTSLPATVALDVTKPRLALSIDPGTDVVRYGQVVDYAVTLSNAGDVANAVPVTFTLSAGLDGDQATLTCQGTGNGAHCEPDPADSLRYAVTLPANRTLTWLLSVPVRSDAAGNEVSLSVATIGADGVTDTRTLVLFRDGFEATDGGGRLPLIEGAQAHAILQGEALHEITVPSHDVGAATLLIARDGVRIVRVEHRVIAGGGLVRLLERGADGTERGTPWSPVQAGAPLLLGSEAASGHRALVLAGAQVPLVL